MTQLSDTFRKLAVRLVKRFGKDGYVIRRYIELAMDPEHPTEPSDIEVLEFGANAVVTEYKTEQIDGVQVLRGDKQVIVAWTETLPKQILPGDLFVDGEEIYNIIPPVEVIGVNGVDVAYVLQVRK